MAKQDFTTDPTLTASFMNTLCGTDAASGHVHSGADADGSCPKVDLSSAAHVTGQLPWANIAYRGAGSFGVKIITTYLTVEQTGTAYFTWFEGLDNRFVVVWLPELKGNPQTSNTQLKISPNTSFPSQVLPAQNIVLPCVAHNRASQAPGSIEIATDQTPWIISVANIETGTDFIKLLSTGFSDAYAIGVERQSLAYRLNNSFA